MTSQHHPFHSRVGFGTSGFGNIPGRTTQDLHSIISALEVGYRLIDTAEKYGEGRCEKLLGEAIMAWGGPRRDLDIVSKVLPSNATSQKQVVESCENSLRRLKSDYIDVYLLHWRKPETNLPATLDAFLELQNKGLIRHFGLSNFSLKDIEIWKIMEKSHGITAGAVTLQTRYSLPVCQADDVLLPWIKEKYPMSIMAHTPLQLGEVFTHSDKLAPLAEQESCTIAQLCLAWILRRPECVVIPKSQSKDRQSENFNAGQVILSADTIHTLDKLFHRIETSS